MDEAVQLRLGVKPVVLQPRVLRPGGPGQIQQLALAALQVHRVEGPEPGLEDRGQLGVPLGVGQLPAHPLVYVLEGEDCVVPGPLLPAEVGGDGDVAVALPPPPLAEHLRFAQAVRPGLSQALQREPALKGVLIGVEEVVLDVQAHQLLPGQGQGRGTAPHLSVHPDGVRRAGDEVDGVNVEVLLPQAADELLAPDADLLPGEALPQRVVDVLDAEDGGAALPAAGAVRNDLHQVPAAARRRLPAVEQGHALPSAPGGVPQVLQPGEADKALRVLRVDRAASGELLELLGEGSIPRLPALGSGFQHIATVLVQIDPQKLSVCIAAGVQAGARDGIKVSAIQDFSPQRSNGMAEGTGRPGQRHNQQIDCLHYSTKQLENQSVNAGGAGGSALPLPCGGVCRRCFRKIPLGWRECFWRGAGHF